MYCSACGTQNDDNNYRCIQCGQILQQPQAPQPQPAAPNYAMQQQPGGDYPMAQRSKVVAGLLQIFLPFGVGRFYLGFAGMGIGQLLLTFLCGIGVIWCVIDGLMILTGSVSHDANGLPLSE